MLKVIELLEERVVWHAKAAAEFRTLPLMLQLEVIQYLLTIIRRPGTGQPLEDKYGMDLIGCKKIYFDDCQKRIVYEVVEGGKVRIWGIGPRLNMQVYKEWKNDKSKGYDPGADCPYLLHLV